MDHDNDERTYANDAGITHNVERTYVLVRREHIDNLRAAVAAYHAWLNDDTGTIDRSSVARPLYDAARRVVRTD